jgi:hypothetical protein
VKWLVIVGALGALYYVSRATATPAQGGTRPPVPLPGGQQGQCGAGQQWIPVRIGDGSAIGDPGILAAGGYCAAASSGTETAADYSGLDAGTARAATVVGRVNRLTQITES